jgi:uncharacterized membrane protein
MKKRAGFPSPLKIIGIYWFTFSSHQHNIKIVKELIKMGELIAGGLLILFCVALSYLMSGIENTVIEVAVSLFLVVMGGILIYLLISFTLDYLEIHTEERKKKKDESGR